MRADELSDDQARDLLHQAARTIEVGPTVAIVPPTHRRRPLVLVAAGLAAAAVVAVAVIGTRGPSADVAPGGGGGARVAVPSVFGLTRDQAEARLEAAGLTVEASSTATCEVDGLALTTVPVAGEEAPASGRVSLVWNDAGAIDCPQDLTQRADAFAFLGFLAGTGPAPTFARSVEVQVDDGPPLTLTAAEAADPTGWYAGSALRTTIRERLDTPGLQLTTTTARGGGTEKACGTPEPAGTADREALSLSVTDPRLHGGEPFVVNGEEQPSPYTCATTVDVYRDSAGAVDAVAIGTQPEGLLAMSLTLTDDRVDADLNRAASGLVDFATGSKTEPPALADDVTLYEGGTRRGELSRADLADLAAWSGCAGSQLGCGASVLAPVAAARTAEESLEVVPTPDPIDCVGAEDAPLPSAVTKLRHAVVQPSSARACGLDFRLTVYVDDQGRIAAVDLVHETS